MMAKRQKGLALGVFTSLTEWQGKIRVDVVGRVTCWWEKVGEGEVEEMGRSRGKVVVDYVRWTRGQLLKEFSFCGNVAY